MAKKKTRKRAAKHAPKVRAGGKSVRCKYVATRGSARVADKLVRELKSDGFRAIKSQTYGAAHRGWAIFSCGRLKRGR